MHVVGDQVLVASVQPFVRRENELQDAGKQMLKTTTSRRMERHMRPSNTTTSQ